MVRNVQATTATGLRKNRVTQKTRLHVVRGQLDADAVVLDDEEERNRVLASQGVDAEDANEHHLQAVLLAASHRKQTSGKQPEAHIPTPDAAGLVEAYESLYPSGKYNPPTTHLRFADTVEETVQDGLAGGFTYFLDERDAEWLEKNNQEARGEGTSASASAGANGIAEDSAVTSTRSGRALHGRGAKGKGKEPEHCHCPRIVVDEDEFELVMGLYEKLTEDKFPFIHLALDTFPPFSDYEPAFATPLPPATFASYLIPSTVPPPERLVLLARAVYTHWKERKLEREGKRVVPQLDYDDTHESSYICFRRRDVKPVRRTRASSTAYTDKLARLRSELQMGLDLAKMVQEREELKKDAAGAAKEVWQARCSLVEGWKNGEGAGVDEGLLFDKERVARPPKPEGLGRIILGLNRRTSGPQSGLGTPGGDAHSPLTAHLDLSTVNLSTLSPLAYVAVQSAARERHKDLQASVEREMASLKVRDIGWEDLVDLPYQPTPLPYPEKLFKAFPLPSTPPALAASPPSFGINPTATLLRDDDIVLSAPASDPDPAPLSNDATKLPVPAPRSSPAPERVSRSLRLRTGRGGRLHLDRRLHVRRAHPLISVERAGWPSTSSTPNQHHEETETKRWEKRDWHPEDRLGFGNGEDKEMRDEHTLGEEYWTHESVYEDRDTALGKRKRPEEDEGDEGIGFEQTGLGVLGFAEWEKGPVMDEEWWRPAPRSRSTDTERVKQSEPSRPLRKRSAVDVERAQRVDERWRYDSDMGRDEDDRFLLDDFQPKFLRTMVTLLDARDHETVMTDPRHLDPPLIPDAGPKLIQSPVRPGETERLRLVGMRMQRAAQAQAQPQPAPALPTPQPSHSSVPSTTPPPPVPVALPQPMGFPQQRMEEQLRRMARQPLPESTTPSVSPQASQRPSVTQQPPTPSPTPAQPNGLQLKHPTFGNGTVADGGATARISAPVRPKSSQQQQQQLNHGANGTAANNFTNGGGFPAHHPHLQNQNQNQNPLALHPGHVHGLNPQQYATLRNVFAEHVPGSQQLPQARVQMQMNGIPASANLNLQTGLGNLNLKVPPTRPAQFRMNGGDVNGAGAPLPVHVTPPRPTPNGNGSPVLHPRTPSANGHLMPSGHDRVSPHMVGRGPAPLSSSPHHHSNLVPLHTSPPPRPTPTMAHQQVVGGPGQGHGYS